MATRIEDIYLKWIYWKKRIQEFLFALLKYNVKLSLLKL